MKVIELLNRIVNNEEIPKKIKFQNIIFKLDEFNDYIPIIDNYMGEELYDYLDNGCLNDEVEILEEDKKIEKLTMSRFTRNQKAIARKVNEVIDYLNKENK